MNFVSIVTLSVNTFLNLFLFFQIFTFPFRDSDKSDKRVQRQQRQGFRRCDKRKHAVTKGVGVGNGQTFVRTRFYELLGCIDLIPRLSDFCHFCHCHGRGNGLRGFVALPSVAGERPGRGGCQIRTARHLRTERPGLRLWGGFPKGGRGKRGLSWWG